MGIILIFGVIFSFVTDFEGKMLILKTSWQFCTGSFL